MPKQAILSMGLLGLFVTLFACGKVTQEVSEKKETPSFKLLFSLEETPSYSPLSETSNFKMTDTVYASIFGINDKWRYSELSWGKILIQKVSPDTYINLPNEVKLMAINVGDSSPVPSQQATPNSPESAPADHPNLPQLGQMFNDILQQVPSSESQLSTQNMLHQQILQLPPLGPYSGVEMAIWLKENIRSVDNSMTAIPLIIRAISQDIKPPPQGVSPSQLTQWINQHILLKALALHTLLADASGASDALLSSDDVAKIATEFQAIANEEEKTSTPDIYLLAKPYNKQGVMLSKSDLSWTFSRFSLKDKEWSFESDKIRRGYPYYLVSTFTNQHNYRLKLIDETVVSANQTVNIDQLSGYDTFIAVLTMMQSAKGQYDETFVSHMKSLYNIDFFTALNYEFPPNHNPGFNKKKPYFKFNREYEGLLLNLLDLARIDRDEAIKYLDTQKAFDQMPADAKGVFKTNLLAFHQARDLRD
ncbi:MAG: hypothetical protein CL521_03285 [Actinobacteria bacterium]|nr:hypothetical protein [Actinomycetota bacterium]